MFWVTVTVDSTVYTTDFYNYRDVNKLVTDIQSNCYLTMWWKANANLPILFYNYFSTTSSSSGHLPPSRSKCPTIPLFSMLCLFLEFPVSVLHYPIHELLSRPAVLNLWVMTPIYRGSAGSFMNLLAKLSAYKFGTIGTIGTIGNQWPSVTSPCRCFTMMLLTEFT